jgi:hypothetical protein
MKPYITLLLIVVAHFWTFHGLASGDATNGYLTAVLRCSSAPATPPPVGETVVGRDYVIKTVARGNPLDLTTAQQVVTDEIFESLMPLYCGLVGRGCFENRVQWNIITYDADGHWRISGGPPSGSEYHYCAVTNGYIVAIVAGESATLPALPPVGQVAVGADAVLMTIADSNPMDLAAARRLATDTVFESLMRRYCALPRGTGQGQASGRARWTVATYDPDGIQKLSGCAASGCDVHECIVSRGFITAVLRAGDAPTSPPPVGQTVVGPYYVIRTLADADPSDLTLARQLATDEVFQSLMPLYCGLNGVENRVQWNILTYDAGGNPRVSASPTSGADFHYCEVTNGYIVAVVAGESATLPALPPVGQIAIGSDAVIMTIADRDPMDLAAGLGLATDAVFESLMRRYCALPRGTGVGQASGRATWTVETFDAEGNPKLSDCATSGCDLHECVVEKGFITAVLRSDCTDGPQPPPPVGAVRVGPDYVIMTVADADPNNYPAAQQLATDAVFETLMPLYCGLVGKATRGCVENRVQWNLMTYDAGGNYRISGSPVSGPAYHYFESCSLTPQKRIENLIVWVDVDVAAGILSAHDGQQLTRLLNTAQRQLDRGQLERAAASLNTFIGEVARLARNEQLPQPAAQTLNNAVNALMTEMSARVRAQIKSRLKKIGALLPVAR